MKLVLPADDRRSQNASAERATAIEPMKQTVQRGSGRDRSRFVVPVLSENEFELFGCRAIRSLKLAILGTYPSRSPAALPGPA
jgi:hypothetical protein